MAPIAFLAVLPFLFLWRLWPGNPADRQFVPEGDFSSQYYPLRAYAATELAHGSLPLWNPYVFGGQPGLADIQMGTLYPTQSLWALASGGALSLGGLQVQMVLHLSLAAVGTFLFVKRLAHGAVPGLAAALAFTFGGYLTSFPIQQLTILTTVSWLPWLLLCVERMVSYRERLASSAAVLAITFALAILAGHPQTAMLVTYCLLAYAGYRLLPCRNRRWERLAGFAGGLALGIGLSASQLLPTIEFVGRSTRAALGFSQVSAGLGLHEVAALLYPGYFGGSPQYTGVVALLLALLAVAFVPWHRVGFWAGMSAVGLLLSFGSGTALYPLFYLLLPGFASSRNQERAIFLFAFGVAVLAGLGAKALGERAWQSAEPASRAPSLPSPLALSQRWLARATVAAAIGLFVLFVGTLLPSPSDTGINLFGGVLKQHVWLLLSLSTTGLLLFWQARQYLSTSWLQAGLLALLTLNLMSVNWRYNLGEAPAVQSAASRELAAYLHERLRPGYRIASGGLLPEGPNAGLLYGLPDITGNTPLRLASYVRFEELVPEWRRWQLLAVAYVCLPSGIQPGANLTQVLPGAPALYQVADPLPPLRLLHEAIPAEGEAAWMTLSSDSYDPSRQAVVPPALILTLAPASAPEQAEIESFEPNHVVARANVSAPALAVFSLIADPGWRASVDGQPSRWLVADGVLLGLPLSSGAHTISLVYRPTSFNVGIVLTVASFVVILGLVPPSQSRHLPSNS
ncbi:MAG: YfhO family protein [Anaerolineae bacterium]